MKKSKNVRMWLLPLIAIISLFAIMSLAACGGNEPVKTKNVYKSMVSINALGGGTYLSTVNTVTTYTDGTYAYSVDSESIRVATEDTSKLYTIGGFYTVYYGTYTETTDEDTGITTLELSAPTRIVYVSDILGGGAAVSDTDKGDEFPEGFMSQSKVSSADYLAKFKGWTVTVGEKNAIGDNGIVAKQ